MSSDEERRPTEEPIDAVAHPATRVRAGRTTAGQAIVVVLVALLTAAALDSRALVRAGLGMRPGLTRSATLAVAQPLNRAAGASGLDLPRRGLDAALRRQDSQGGVISGASVPPPLPSAPGPSPQPGASPAGRPTASPPPPSPPLLRVPTRSRPLRVLVTGDSLSTYVADDIDQLAQARGLLSVTGISADGTGLTNPAFYNWQKQARAQVRAHHPEVVVMVIGGNDGWGMTSPSGQRVSVGSQAWVDEYARRVVAIMQTYRQGGVSAVYWSGPPTARNPLWNRLYRKLNEADQRAALAVPGARYVDLYRGTAVDGRYADRVRYAGRVIAHSRQADGVHWTLDGALLPASLELAAIAQDVGRPLD